MASEYEEAKAALGVRDPIGDLVALNRRLQKRFEHEEALEAEVRALREALEEIKALPDRVEPRGSEGMKPRSVEMGRLIGMQDAAFIARCALPPEPPDATDSTPPASG